MSAYDVVVLGGGSAGSAAAQAAQAAGARTAMVNDSELGGLCILRGCMPTKSMLAAAHAIHEAEHLEPFGARLEGRVVPDFARIMQRRGEHVARFQRAKVKSIEAAGYDVIRGRGRFVPGGTLEVDGRPLTARSWVIATGSEPVRLAIPGIEHARVLTSDDVMELTERPRRILVQGAGAIGLELGQFFARVGTEVTLVTRSPLLSRLDAECGEELTRAFAAEPRYRMHVPGSIERVDAAPDGFVAHVESGGRTVEVAADALLMAAGRRAALDDIGLEHVGISVENDRIPCDDTMRTSNPRVWAAGDATGCWQLLHVANQEGRAAGHNAAGGDGTLRVDRRLDMWMIFTDPTYAQVGETEARALARGADIVVGRARFPETGRAITMSVGFGLWKLIVDRSSREILGTSILGPRADDLAHTLTALIWKRVRIDDVFDLPWYHPTLSEVMIDLARDVIAQIGPPGPAAPEPPQTPP